MASNVPSASADASFTGHPTSEIKKTKGQARRKSHHPEIDAADPVAGSEAGGKRAATRKKKTNAKSVASGALWPRCCRLHCSYAGEQEEAYTSSSSPFSLCRPSAGRGLE